MSGFKLLPPGQVMNPEPGTIRAIESVLKPAAVRDPNGKFYPFAQLALRGNYSRIRKGTHCEIQC